MRYPYHSHLHIRSLAHSRRPVSQWWLEKVRLAEAEVEAGPLSMGCQEPEVALGWRACRMSLTVSRGQSKKHDYPRAISHSQIQVSTACPAQMDCVWAEELLSRREVFQPSILDCALKLRRLTLSLDQATRELRVAAVVALGEYLSWMCGLFEHC